MSRMSHFQCVFSATNFFSHRFKKLPVSIIGGGQSGLMLGIGLRKQGIPVSLFTNRTAEQVLNGNILSSQGMFNSALLLERRLGLNFWDSTCPKNKAVTFSLIPPNAQKPVIRWLGLTDEPYQSVDQRLKFSRWLQEFQRLNGQLYFQDVGLKELNTIAQDHALTIVAGGKGEISQAFPRNKIRSHFDKPQRILACLYVNNITPVIGLSGVRVNLIPGIGEFFIMPGLTINGSCEMMLFEGIPGGAFDCWQGITDSQQLLEQALRLLKKFVPLEAERCTHARLTDPRGTLVGSYTPVVRYPTFNLPCGKPVLGIGDTLNLNDPIAGQGANNACKAAFLYLNRIIEQSQQKGYFDEIWMKKTYEMYWESIGKWATKWSHIMLMPPAPHMVDLLNAASQSPAIANTLANGFDDPSTLFPWISHPEDTEKFIKGIEQEESHLTSSLRL